jgi:hypothetical protein
MLLVDIISSNMILKYDKMNKNYNLKFRDISFFLIWAAVTIYGLTTPSPTILNIPTQKIDGITHTLIFFVGFILARQLLSFKMSAILIAIAALLSEVSQISIVSRTLSLKDLGFNLLGLGLGAIISKWIDGKKRTKYST